MRDRIPKGDIFLPDVEMKELESMYRGETSPKAMKRLLAIMARKNGHTQKEISEFIHEPEGTVRGWLRRVADSGLAMIYDIKRDGPARRLTDRQLASIKDDLLAGPEVHGLGSGVWSGKVLAEHIRRKYGVQYKPRRMQMMLHEMGFSLIMPRPRHPKAASKGQSREFKKKLHG